MKSKHLSALCAAILASSALWALPGCGASELRPVELYPEDNCALCRMAISDPHFASEIVDRDGDAVKFDDIGCMLQYRATHAGAQAAGIFLKDYETLEWLRYEQASIVQTGLSTPMGSGNAAFSRADKAREFQKAHPALAAAADTLSCCED